MKALRREDGRGRERRSNGERGGAMERGEQEMEGQSREARHEYAVRQKRTNAGFTSLHYATKVIVMN